MTKVLYILNASCRHPTQHFTISQSKVPHFDLMSLLTTGHYTSPQNWFLYSCAITNPIAIVGRAIKMERAIEKKAMNQCINPI